MGNYNVVQTLTPVQAGKLGTPSQGSKREVDIRPAWMGSSQGRNLDTLSDDSAVPDNRDRKKARLWVLIVLILSTATSKYVRPMSLDIDNGLPGIEMWFGTNKANEVGFLCHLDTCAVMNTYNLKDYQWLMTQYPGIVAEYLQYDDKPPFESLQLQAAIEDLEKSESEHEIPSSYCAVSLTLYAGNY